MKSICRIILISILLLAACTLVPVRNAFVVSSPDYPALCTDESAIRVLSWNVYKQSGRPGWQREFQHIVEFKKPDLFLLQEVCLEETFIQMMSVTGVGWAFSPNIFQGDQNAYSGVLTGSRAKPVDADALLSNGLEPILNTPKSALLSRYVLSPSKTQLMVANLHALNFGSFAEFQEQLQHIALRIANHEGPVILAGDFNTWKKSRMRYLEDIAKSLGLFPVGFNPESRQMQAFICPLDHIFYSPRYLSVKPGSPVVLESAVSSDHKPLFVEFMLAPTTVKEEMREIPEAAISTRVFPGGRR